MSRANDSANPPRRKGCAYCLARQQHDIKAPKKTDNQRKDADGKKIDFFLSKNF